MKAVSHQRIHLFLVDAVRHRVWLACACLLLLLVVVGVAYQRGKEVGLNRVERTLDGRINSHKQYLLQALGKYWLVPDVMASSQHVKQMLLAPTQVNVELANGTLDELAERTGVDRIYVIDETGTTLAANARKDTKTIIGENYRFRPYFKDAMAGITGHFIGIGVTSPIIGYYLAKPVFVEGRIRGVVAMRISLSLESFRSLVKKYWQDNSEIALITDDNGVVFMSPSDKWDFKTIGPLSERARDEIRTNRQYENRLLQELPMKIGSVLSDDMRFVRFDDIPDRQFVRKSYDMAEFGGRTYMHIDTWVYWEPVISYTVSTALAGIAVLLCCFAGMQHWIYQYKLLQAAIRDPLTGLHTRLYMNEWIEQAMRSCARNPEKGMALILFDMDHFKRINDTYGHLAGDAVLKSAGKIIADSIRGEDLAVRFGGEEMAVFIRCANVETATAMAERIRQRIAMSGIETPMGTLRITISGGVAFHASDESMDELFSRADKLLYQAKAAGRNQVCDKEFEPQVQAPAITFVST